ncbi:phosphoribosyltransferase family protein [Buchananella felis]|uniref:ComF family protein n=1 Tax=Buchananella felis TaxID=3231492 RepID=UPI003528A17A
MEKTNQAHQEGGAGWRTAGAALLDLLVPVECAGCGRQSQRLCPACQRSFAALTLVDNAAPLPVLALDRYDGAARAMILAYKDRHRTDVDEFLEGRARAAGWWLSGQLGQLRRVLVVPAPSGWRRRWRGALVAARLAQAVAEGIASNGRQARAIDALRRAGGGSQAGRGARSRARRSRMRLSGRVVRVALGPGGCLAGRAVVLVDDVVTSGATLQEARRVLEAAGALVLAAVVLAAVPARG